MHTIRAMDFFFISCIKCHSEGQPGLAARLAHLRFFLLLLPLHEEDLTTGINMQAALVSICWLRVSSQLFQGRH